MMYWCSVTASLGRARVTARFPPSREKITGTAWSGPLFFGLKPNRSATLRDYRGQPPSQWKSAMTRAEASRKRCAIYTRKSSEEGLEQEFNSLAAQREACEAFIRSQRNEGWVL